MTTYLEMITNINEKIQELIQQNAKYSEHVERSVTAEKIAQPHSDSNVPIAQVCRDNPSISAVARDDFATKSLKATTGYLLPPANSLQLVLVAQFLVDLQIAIDRLAAGLSQR